MPQTGPSWGEVWPRGLPVAAFHNHTSPLRWYNAVPVAMVWPSGLNATDQTMF